MRIEGSNRSGSVSGKAGSGRAGAGPAFVPAGAEAPARAAAALPVAPAAGLDAILALQAVGSATEGRRRAVRRGRTLLDLLEEIKADLLVGALDSGRLDALAGQLAGLRERVEPGLDTVLDEIDLRVRVELAKRGRYPAF